MTKAKKPKQIELFEKPPAPIAAPIAAPKPAEMPANPKPENPKPAGNHPRFFAIK
jgi:hypothetical protein